MNAIEMVRINMLLVGQPPAAAAGGGGRHDLYELSLRGSDPKAVGCWLYPGSTSMELSLQDMLARVEESFATVHPIAYACALMMVVYTVHPFRVYNAQMAQLCFAYGLARHGITAPVLFSDGHQYSADHQEYAKKRALGYFSTVGSTSHLHTMGVMALHKLLNNLSKFY
jgi:hypothetical protein